MPVGGTYVLVIPVKERLSLEIGRLGTHDFPCGYYLYVGSALGGLDSRLKHHLKSAKRPHWHIDYLLREARVATIWYALGQDRLECKLNAMLAGLPGAAPIVPGFGSSDCRCDTHLTHFSAVPSPDSVVPRLRCRTLW